MTIRELISKLQMYPPDAVIATENPDSNGGEPRLFGGPRVGGVFSYISGADAPACFPRGIVVLEVEPGDPDGCGLGGPDDLPGLDELAEEVDEKA